MTRKVKRYVSQAFLLVLGSRNLEHLGAKVPVILRMFDASGIYCLLFMKTGSNSDVKSFTKPFWPFCLI